MSVLLHTDDLGKGSYCKEKYQENIEDVFLINTKNDNPS